MSSARLLNYKMTSWLTPDMKNQRQNNSGAQSQRKHFVLFRSNEY